MQTDATNPAPAATAKAEAAPAQTTSAPEAAPAVAAPEATPDEASNVEKDSAKPEAAPAAPAAAPSPSPSPNASPSPSPAPAAAQLCSQRTIDAEVIALAQPYMLNRMGASMPHAVIYALAHDVSPFPAPSPGGYVTNNMRLQPWKRARPIVLRANEGDCIRVRLTNLIDTNAGGSSTGPVSLHAQGMQAVNSIDDDGSYVGANSSSLADPLKSKTYTLLAQKEGTFLLYSEGDTNTMGQQLQHGLFGAVNVQPAGAEWYRSQVTEADLELAIDRTKGNNGRTPAGQPILNYDARYPANYKDAPRACAPILKMVAPEQEVVTVNGVKQCQAKAGGAANRLYHSDLTAIITGPNKGRFPGTTGVGRPEPPCDRDGQPVANVNPLFCTNPTLPDRKQPYREITVIYHEVTVAVQAFPIFKSGSVQDPANPNDPTKQIPNPAQFTVEAGQDLFAINYGTGGIGAEIYANRIGVGPMANCVDCKFEEFFLTSWAVGDPAMVVDTPANYVAPTPPAPPAPACNPGTLKAAGTPNNCLIEATKPLVTAIPSPPPPQRKATMAFYPDDPSNVYHSYLNDHVKFRILHGGTGVTHVHHQHAHQWLQSPNSSDASYLDSQFISPGASYSLEMVYGGSGNRNKTIGDSIFHCHFYPHFAAGMWSMWRVHDVLEEGTELDPDGKPRKGARALPDGEIVAGTPIPALVPVPTLPMPLMPSPVFIDNGQIVFGTTAQPDPTGQNVTANPGYPFFIPGVAGMRPPHPPLDFAPVLNAQGNPVPGQFLDGGLPRHVNTGGTAEHELIFTTDVNNWSKDFKTLDARQLPEDGTNVEKVAITYNNTRCRASFLPDGSPNNPFGPTNYPECGAGATQAQFILNGLPNGPQRGSPFADPAITSDGKPAGMMKRYKAAVFQMDLAFNKQQWHFGQQRLLALWQDVAPTINKTRRAEPLFFRANSEEHFIEYWHTNLVPNYYDRDAFQVRTPTDIIGQHIHNVKFDVTSSDGAANGWNYEDGTFSPGEVQDVITAINAAGGITTVAGTKQPLPGPKAPPAEILNCSANPNDARCKPCSPPAPGGPACVSWLGAQTTVQRWYADPFRSNPGTSSSGPATGSNPPRGTDNTMRTVFTHDHFGPSTHQQGGLYAGLVIEPKGSKWFANDSNQPFGPAPNPGRTDGGPTSWQARIVTANLADSYREFVLEFQDLTLAYWPAPRGTAINPPGGEKPPGQTTPTLISTGGQPPPGTQTVNYYNAPLPFRTQGNCDITEAYTSDCKMADSPDPRFLTGDPETPLMRAYENDRVQVRTLVGAHTFSHFFTMAGPRWFFEPSWNNSGYRNSQGMGISEHFEMLFTVPPSSMTQANRRCPDGKASNCVDYLYSPSDDNFGLTNGMWGLLRAYDPRKPLADVKPLPVQSNPLAPGKTIQPFAPCPANLAPQQRKKFNITAVAAQTALPPGGDPAANAMLFNPRGTSTGGKTLQSLGMMYVFTEDLDPATGRLKGPVEPLILRANAGDCIDVTLTNALDTTAPPFTSPLLWPKPFDTGLLPLKTSRYVGLHPQLLSYDGATDGGFNVGYNDRSQTAAPGQKVTYRWYAGAIDRNANGSLKYTPVEFGSLNLLPADPISHHFWGLYGGMVVEPAGSKWMCESDDPSDPTGIKKIPQPCEPTSGFDPSTAKNYTRAAATVTSASGATLFREFVTMVSENVVLNDGNRSAVNYRVEPTFFRFGNTNGNAPQFAADGNNSCALANVLVGGDPQTPIFTAAAGTPFRFRLLHPQGTGTAQVFVLNGHVWQREPYTNKSTVIGDNPLSQWMGSHDSFGGTDHYDLVGAKAGGQNEVPGDYLYTTFVPNQNLFGSWGLFRVLDKNGNQVKGNQVAGSRPNSCPTVPGRQYGVGQPSDTIRRFVRQPFGTR
ncbi:MAG TPA: hypothetical protein VE360_09450 [Pyrinomonadaceae bacterium]|nr:hypothetical protein [Pyrinomonadaceae bacterium]